MSYIPENPVWDNFEFDLFDADGTFRNTLRNSLSDFSAWTIPGVTAHRCESGEAEIPCEAVGYSDVDFNKVQLVRVVPYGLDTHALWALIGKPKDGYDERGKQDKLKLILTGVEYLLMSRRCYTMDGGEPVRITSGAEHPDDFAKQLVRLCALPGTCLPRKDASSRNWEWGTLSVEADTAEVPIEADGFTIPTDTRLYDAINALAQSYSFDWELRVTISGGAATYTFRTKYPRGGTDRTTATPQRVIINDIGAMIPSAKRFRDWWEVSTVTHSRDLQIVVRDTTAISKWGSWEGVVNELSQSEVEMAADQLGMKEGAEYEYNLNATEGQCRWLSEYFCGDLVLRNNTRLGIAAASDKIAGIHMTFPKKRLKLEIRWGDKEPGLTDKQGGRRFRPAPQPVIYPQFGAAQPIAATNVNGSSEDMIRADHQHKGVIVVGAVTVGPVAGVFTLASTDSSIVITPNSPVAGTIDIKTAIPGGCYWDRNAVAAPFLFPRTVGDNVRVVSGAGAEMVELHNDGTVDAQSSYLSVSGAYYCVSRADGSSHGMMYAADHLGSYLNIWSHGVAIDFHAGYPSSTSVMLAQAYGFVPHTDQSTALGYSVGAVNYRWLDLQTMAGTVHGDFKLYSGGDFKVYSDAGSTLKASIDGATGNLSLVSTATTELGGYTYTWPTSGAVTGETLTATVVGTAITLDWAAPTPAAHNILNATTHGDAQTAGCLRGAVIVGNATPIWSRLNLGASGEALMSNGLDAVFGNPNPAAHDIVGARHTLTGAAMSVVGATALNTLGLLTPSSSPGAASALLKSDASGYLTLVRLTTTDQIQADSDGVSVTLNAGVVTSSGELGLVATGANAIRLTTNGVGRLFLSNGGNFYPLAANTYTCGSAGAEWANIHSVLGTFTGNVSISTGSYPTLSLISSSASGGQLVLQSSTATWSYYVQGTQLRWYLGADILTLSTTALNPAVTNTVALGDTTTPLRYSLVAGVLANFSGQITSTLVTGTAPFAVMSTTLNTNLNSDLFENYHGAATATANTFVLRDAASKVFVVGADLGTGAIVNVGLVDGVDVSAHTHVITGVTGGTQVTLSGHTDGYTFATSLSLHQLEDASATVYEVWARVNGSSDSGAWFDLGIRTAQHWHDLTGGTYGTGVGLSHSHDKGTLATSAP